MNERVNKMNELQEQHKKRMAEWLASVPHVDELLALQLQGTIPKQMPGDVQKIAPRIGQGPIYIGKAGESRRRDHSVLCR